jgi:hypothetical protein
VKYLKDAALGLPQSVEELDEYATELKPIFGKILTELRALEPPEDLEDDYEELIASDEAAFGRLDELAEAGAQGDTSRVEEIVFEEERADREDDRLATEIGLRNCEQDDIFEGDGYSFSYPEEWEERELEVRLQEGDPLSSRALGPEEGANLLSIQSFRFPFSVNESNIDEGAVELGVVWSEAFQQANGTLTAGPTRVTVGGLPGYSFEGSAVIQDGLRAQERVVTVWDGTTEYVLNCQFAPERADENATRPPSWKRPHCIS